MSWLILVLGLILTAQTNTDWPLHGGVDNIRYSPLTQINQQTVSRLAVAWTYDSHDAFKGSEMQSNPVVVDGVIYLTTPTLKVVAVDARTGREIWKFDPSGGASAGRFRHRGVTVHKDIDALGPLLQGLGYTDESQVLQEFTGRFAA